MLAVIVVLFSVEVERDAERAKAQRRHGKVRRGRERRERDAHGRRERVMAHSLAQSSTGCSTTRRGRAPRAGRHEPTAGAQHHRWLVDGPDGSDPQTKLKLT